MRPEPGLTENGKRIFEALIEYLKDSICEVDVFQLTNLAQAFDLAERCRDKINFPDRKDQQDGIQMTKNGYTQVTGYVTVMDKANTQIEKIGAKFGLSPSDREKIKGLKNPTKSRAHSMTLEKFMKKG